MTNSDIADLIKAYADLSELHGGNPFKIKSYASAAFKIDKLPAQLTGLSIEELEKVDGVGKSLASKIYDICTTGSFSELKELLGATPEGVQQMMRIKGIGPKKIGFIWKELGIENTGELLYACRENRLAQAKGFGLKTQENVIRQIEFMLANAEKFHYARIEPVALDLLKAIGMMPGIAHVSFSGAIRRKMEVLNDIELIVAAEEPSAAAGSIAALFTETSYVDAIVYGRIQGHIPVKVFISDVPGFHLNLFFNTGNSLHISQLPGLTIEHPASEAAIYESMGMQYIEPELREGNGEIEKAALHTLPQLISTTDLRGILHNHSTYSDGLHTLEEMAVYCKELGYQYLGICDHSRSAFYANGMKEETVKRQHAEIESLNNKLGADGPFRIFKGIESDILNDGSLDYSNEVLASFDFVVASVHSNLKMTEEKATARLVKAIENPYTTILGHPTGRLLLMREGYPVDHRTIIDACAANGVVIEINANPYRLDLDWRWMGYALEKGVKLSINPDAHEREGYHDMYYGVCVARKGGLYREMCLNALDLHAISAHFASKKPGNILSL
jgi:DNA polymerase (family 10)